MIVPSSHRPVREIGLLGGEAALVISVGMIDGKCETEAAADTLKIGADE
jgi:hypothetical protein